MLFTPSQRRIVGVAVVACLMSSWCLASAATILYTYDGLGRLTRVDYGRGTTEEYTYDAAGNLLRLVRTRTTGPDLTVTPSQTFGGVQALRLAAAQTFTITNTGTGNLIISTITLTGADAAAFTLQEDTCSGQTIVPTGTCSVRVVLVSRLAGMPRATLSIASNDFDTPTVDIALHQPPDAQDDSVLAAPGTATVIAVLANDTSASGTALRIVAVTQGAHGTVSTDGTRITYTPDATFVATDTFVYVVSDGLGGTDHGHRHGHLR